MTPETYWRGWAENAALAMLFAVALMAPVYVIGAVIARRLRCGR